MSQPQAVPAAAPLDYTPAVALSTAAVGARLRTVILAIEWQLHAPYVAAIAEWKRRRNAVILAHNYQTPEIYHGVADFTGDSLALAQHGARTEAEVIVLAGVHFMAETAKILSPEKTVLIPDLRAGCSLAASITAADVRLLRQRYPGVPVVTYVITSAAVKAESDVCCTSAKALAVVESLGVPRVIFLPDEYLGRYVAEQTAVEIILWRGHCEVHERFTAEDLRGFRAAHPDVRVLAHPECPPEVLAEAGFVGSTAAGIRDVGEGRPRGAGREAEDGRWGREPGGGGPGAGGGGGGGRGGGRGGSGRLDRGSRLRPAAGRGADQDAPQRHRRWRRQRLGAGRGGLGGGRRRRPRTACRRHAGGRRRAQRPAHRAAADRRRAAAHPRPAGPGSALRPRWRRPPGAGEGGGAQPAAHRARAGRRHRRRGGARARRGGAPRARRPRRRPDLRARPGADVRRRGGRRAGPRSARAASALPGAGGGAGDRPTGTALPLHHQPAGSDRRRAGDGGARRCPARRSRVRAVPPAGARRGSPPHPPYPGGR